MSIIDSDQASISKISPIKIKQINKEQNNLNSNLAQNSLFQLNLEEIDQCPVFKPSMADLTTRTFSQILSEYEKNCGDSAIFKVCMPDEWIPRKNGYQNLQLTVKKPIEQNVSGNKGIYQLTYFVNDSRSLDRFQKQAKSFDDFKNSKRSQNIEKLFWKTLKHSPPLYGADVPGSLFDAQVPWNLAEIQTILKDGLQGTQMLGVTNPYLYFGSWKSMFSWHKEDMDLYSINFLHYGQPKIWYSVDKTDNEVFENYVSQNLKEQFQDCSEYLRHKTTLIHPENLVRAGIKIRKIVQMPREFVVTRAAGYHSGFNTGFNCAEAVNFALDSWLTIGEKARACKCIRDSVQINMNQFKQTLKGNKENQQLKQPLPQTRVLRSQSKQATKVPEKRKVLEVKCKKCGQETTLQMSYLRRYDEGRWATNFVCYKLKLRKFFCIDQQPQMQPFEPPGQQMARRRQVKAQIKEESPRAIFKVTKEVQKKPQKPIKTEPIKADLATTPVIMTQHSAPEIAPEDIYIDEYRPILQHSIIEEDNNIETLQQKQHQQYYPFSQEQILLNQLMLMQMQQQLLYLQQLQNVVHKQ